MSSLLVHPKHRVSYFLSPNKINPRIISTHPKVLYSQNGNRTRWRLMLMDQQLEQGSAGTKREAQVQAQRAKRSVLERNGWAK